MEATKRFYWSKKWKKVQANYKKQAGGLCERCKARGLLVPAVIVHHKIHLTEANYLDESVALDPDNLEALCFDCHQTEHFKNKDCRDDLFFDSDGNLRKGKGA